VRKDPGSDHVRFLFGDGGRWLEELGEEMRGEVP
jgi:hypothetical protein